MSLRQQPANSPLHSRSIPEVHHKQNTNTTHYKTYMLPLAVNLQH